MKDELREKIKIKRRYFQHYQREMADLAIRDNFLSLFKDFESFLIYNPLPYETDTRPIIERLLKEGKRVYLPRVEGDSLVAVPYGKTEKGAFGIDEPTGQAYFGEIDVTVIPLLAVNGRGYRLGYGKGYFDRYLKDRHTVKVGLGYFFQIEDFKEDEWDIPLDKFICEKGWYGYAIDG